MLCAALFKRNISLYLLRVGLCSHTVLTLQATWRLGGRRIGAAEIAWTQVHAIIKYITCGKWRFKWDDRRAHRSPRGDRRRAHLHKKIRPHDCELTATRRPIFFYSRRRSGASDSNLTAAKTRGRVVRSRPDRTAIAARSNRDQTAIVAPSAAESPPDDRTTTDN